MSRASINTGGIAFNLSEQASGPSPRAGDSAMHITVLADFSGRKSRGQEQADTLDKRKLLEVNRDNIDEVFTKLDVQLQLPINDQPLVFKTLDDLHPDFIYQRVGLFDKLRTLKRKLHNKDRFGEAAEEIQAWADYKGQRTAPAATPQGIPIPDNLLEAALRGHDIADHLTAGTLGNIDNLIKDIVSPFLEAKSDPRQADMLAAVNAATGETMRAIMHHSDFQQLEASWRGLYWLLRRIEMDSKLRVYLMDIAQQELRADLARPDADSVLFQQLVEARRTADGTPFAMILGDYQLYPTSADAALATQMAALAAAGNACWLSGGHEQLAGCQALSADLDPDHWPGPDQQPASVQEAWQQLRKLPSARHLALVAPRFLLRLPFGRKTASTDNFDYEELAQDGAHGCYLWGNGAFLVASLLAQGYCREGWRAQPGHYTDVEDLPLHVYEDDGDAAVKPCAEVLLTDRAAGALNDAGLLTIRSIHNRDSVRVSDFQSLAADSSRIQGLW